MCRHIATKVGINSASGFLKGHIYVYKNLYNGDFKETVLRIFHTAIAQCSFSFYNNGCLCSNQQLFFWQSEWIYWYQTAMSVKGTIWYLYNHPVFVDWSWHFLRLANANYKQLIIDVYKGFCCCECSSDKLEASSNSYFSAFLEE